MDLFSWTEIYNLLKSEPGSGLLQSVLLFMIWLTSRGLRKEMADLKEALTNLKIGIEVRIGTLENETKHLGERVAVLEQKGE